jgi:hypothetical protein
VSYHLASIPYTLLAHLPNKILSLLTPLCAPLPLIFL